MSKTKKKSLEKVRRRQTKWQFDDEPTC